MQYRKALMMVKNSKKKEKRFPGLFSKKMMQLYNLCSGGNSYLTNIILFTADLSPESKRAKYIPDDTVFPLSSLPFQRML